MAATADDLLRVLEEIRDARKQSGPQTANQPSSLDAFAQKATRASVALAGFAVVFDRMMEAMGRQLTRFVALANPAAVVRFNIALDNAMSAMGRVFLPILERFTAIIQKIGNAIESLSPQAKAMIGALSVGGGLAAIFAAGAAAAAILIKVLGGWVSIILLVVSAVAGALVTMKEGKSLLTTLGAAFKAVGSIIEVLAQIFVVVFVPAIELVAKVIKSVAEFIAFIVKKLAALVGIEVDYDPNKKNAMAVRQSQVTSLQAFANRAYTSAFGGAAATVDDKILSENQKHTKLMEQILAKMDRGEQVTQKEWRAAQPENRGRFGVPLIERQIKGIQKFNRDATDWVRDRMQRLFD